MRWSPPAQPNGIITGYQVIYFVYQIPSTKMISGMLDNTTTEFFIETLSEYKIKQFYIIILAIMLYVGIYTYTYVYSTITIYLLFTYGFLYYSSRYSL